MGFLFMAAESEGFLIKTWDVFVKYQSLFLGAIRWDDCWLGNRLIDWWTSCDYHKQRS